MPTKVQVQLLLGHWQKVLNLDSWRITLRYTTKLSIPNALLQVTPTRDRHIAIIAISDCAMEISGEDFEPLLVHELVHLIYDPIAEEHGIQIKYIDDSGQRSDEYKSRFLHALERAVEHTTVVLTPLLLLKKAIQDDEDDETRI